MHLERLITVLETIAVAGKPLNANELHQETALPLPTCYRLLQTLRDARLLDEANERNTYLVGQRLIRLVSIAQTDRDVCTAAAPMLQDASNTFSAAVFLSRATKSGVRIIHVETPEDRATAYVHPGLGHRPMHACSCGKVLAAFADEKWQHSLFSKRMKAYTDKTCTSKADLIKEFSAIRKNGYAECVEEIETGISSVAVPVTLPNQVRQFSIGVTGSVRHFTPAYRQKLGKNLISLSDQLAGKIFSNSHIESNRQNSTTPNSAGEVSAR